MNPRKHLSGKLGELQQRLGTARGKQYWRTLEELADTEAFQELLRQEFPEQAAAATTPLSRRQFLTLMGASLALAGVSGCSVRPAPSREIVPYVRAPEEIVPGKPLFFATTMTLGGASVGLLVESHLGRPTKIEGNPEHPGSGNPREPLGQGATDIYSQASVLTLYDLDRSQSVTHTGQIRTWDEALTLLRDAVEKQKARRGGGLRLLSETIVSPTLGSQIEAFLKAFPDAHWHQYEPLAPDTAYRGSLMAFGQAVHAVYDFRKADRVLSLGADFLACGPGSLRYVADFMSRRRVRTTVEDAPKAQMNRLYVVETAVSNTGAKADHRLALPPSQIEGVARAVAGHLGVVEAGSGGGPHMDWAAVVAQDLQEHRGRSIILAGDAQPASVHLLAHAINDRLGNVGQTMRYTESAAFRPMDQTQSLRELVDAMDRGQVEVLLILGGNPVFTAPADFRFTERMQKVPLRIHLSLYQDETSRQCHWHLPEAHYLEAWSDGRAFDGTASIAQPLIAPLYGGRSAHEVLTILTDQLQRPGYEIVRDYWRRHWRKQGSTGGDFEQFWQTAVHDGVVPDTVFSSKNVRLAGDWQRHLQQSAPQATPRGYELVFQPDPTIYDGRFANNGWLQELPKPLTKITWDNAALMSPAMAEKLGVQLGAYAHGGEHGGFEQDVVELRLGDRNVRLPAWIMPGHADDSVTVYLGYGRDYAGKVGGMDGRKVGADVYPLRTSEHPGFVADVDIHKTGERYPLACTQQHQLMENRQTVRSDTLARYRHTNPTFAAQKDEEEEHEDTHRARTPLSMYEQPFKYPGHKWGMAIDLTTCVGCNACVVACQAENNIPVVGKEQVLAGREMHWLRIDRYLSGPFDTPREFYFQPVPCMHCENAPCEYVCPVEATVHSADGLNDMIYQRCVGTRFCSNNCPYKVRRFNFFFYADYTNPSLRQQYNPDVTVRSRGVMEKCSYCVQRIRHAEINSQKENRSIVDGEVLTACQAACPAGAIVFGDINDEHSIVHRWKQSPLHYGLLTDLNTQPRTTYLAALRNPNSKLEAKHHGQ